MPRVRVGGPAVVYRSARVGLRLTPARARRVWGLLRSGGDVWACVLELNLLRRRRGDVAVVGYQALCRELARSGPGTFGELDSVGARSVLRRYSDAWMAAAQARRQGCPARFPRRERRLIPIRWYAGTFVLDGRRLRLPTAAGVPPLWLRLGRTPPYPAEQVRSVTILADAGRLVVEVTAEVPVAVYPTGEGPDRARVAGVDLGVIHPYAVAGPDRHGLVVSGRAVRAECRQHLRQRKARQTRTRRLEGRHRRRLAQARHQAARAVTDWAVAQRVGTLIVGDPVGVLDVDAGTRHNQRVRDWRPGQLKTVLPTKPT